MNKLSTIVLASLTLIPTGTLNAESFQKNYVNQCSDPGFGGCPTIRTPYQVPHNNQIIPHPVPQLVPKMLPVLEPRKYMGVPKLQESPEPMKVNVPQAIPNRVPNLEPKPMKVNVPQAIPNRIPMQVPYLVPNRIPDMVPQPVPNLVPKQVLPEQKIPGFAKTLGIPGEVNVEVQPKENKMNENNYKERYEKIDRKTSHIKKALKLISIKEINNEIIKETREALQTVRGVSEDKTRKSNEFYVLGGCLVAGSLVLKRRNNG